MRIKDISPENRPRERLKQNGVDVLSNSELLAIILQKGTKSENVIDMSNRVLSKYSIEKLSECSLTELKSISGVGDAKAMQIKALFEFNKRYNLAKKDGKPITNAKDVFDYATQILKTNDKEYFIVLLLDSKHRVIKHETVSTGILNASIIHPREIFKLAIKESTNSLILVHNHPSGDPTPSEEDKEITERLEKAAELLDINVVDHVIIGKEKHFSFKDKKG